MLTSRTVIGIVVGAAIIGIASASMVLDLTRGPLAIEETFNQGESTTYRINGDAGASHSIQVTAERFELELNAPGEDGQSIPRSEFVQEFAIGWTHQESGDTRIFIQNTGGDQMRVSGLFEVSGDPIFFIYHIMVITTGVVIIGFSLTFSIRKPRGF